MKGGTDDDYSGISWDSDRVRKGKGERVKYVIIGSLRRLDIITFFEHVISYTSEVCMIDPRSKTYNYVIGNRAGGQGREKFGQSKVGSRWSGGQVGR